MSALLDHDLAPETAAVPKADGVVHIVDGPVNPATDGIDVWTAICGEQCVAWPDGDVTPEGFDFYLLGSGHEAASCVACRAKAGLK